MTTRTRTNVKSTPEPHISHDHYADLYTARREIIAAVITSYMDYHKSMPARVADHAQRLATYESRLASYKSPKKAHAKLLALSELELIHDELCVQYRIPLIG